MNTVNEILKMIKSNKTPLLACPFCECEVISIDCYAYPDIDEPESWTAEVVCANCAVKMKSGSITATDDYTFAPNKAEEIASRKWNRR